MKLALTVVLAFFAIATLAPLSAAHSEQLAPRAHFDPLAEYRQGLDGANNAGPYAIEFRCGDADEEGLVCPLGIEDVEDIMGQPRLVLHPKDWEKAAFNALHGGPGLQELLNNDPPSPQARYNVVHQPHTTFRTTSPFTLNTNGFLDWQDQPYYSPIGDSQPGDDPSPLCPYVCAGEVLEHRDIYGVGNGLAISDSGKMVEASLYAYQNQSANDLSHALAVWKQEGPHKERNQATNMHVRWLGEGDHADRVDAVYAPAVQRFAVLWRQVAADSLLPESGPTSWIDAAWADDEHNSFWESLPTEQRVGPCRDVTNAVASGHGVFIGCVVDEGYTMRPDAATGELDVYFLRPLDGTMQYVSTAPVSGVSPNLALARDGASVAAASRIENGEAIVEFSFGNAFGNWTSPINVADQDPDLGDGGANQDPLIEARIQALAYRQNDDRIFFILLERYDRPGDLSNLAAAPEYKKFIGAVQPNGNLLDARDLGIGNPAERPTFPPQVQGLDEAVFGDQHDDLDLWLDEDGNERLFVAYADYGLVRFGEIVEVGDQPLPAAAPGPPAPPQPLADPGLNQAANQAMAGVIGGALAGAIALRMLLARKASSASAPTPGGKH